MRSLRFLLAACGLWFVLKVVPDDAQVLRKIIELIEAMKTALKARKTGLQPPG